MKAKKVNKLLDKLLDELAVYFNQGVSIEEVKEIIVIMKDGVEELEQLEKLASRAEELEKENMQVKHELKMTYELLEAIREQQKGRDNE